jgi:hypothetical protein
VFLISFRTNKLALPFKIDFKHCEPTVESIAGVDQADGAAATDNAKPEGQLTAQSLCFIDERPNHSRVERWHIVVLLGSILAVSTFESIDLQPQFAKGDFRLNLDSFVQSVFVFHCVPSDSSACNAGSVADDFPRNVFFAAPAPRFP